MEGKHIWWFLTLNSCFHPWLTSLLIFYAYRCMESGLQFRYQASWSAILEVVRVMFEVLDSVLFFLFANVNIVHEVSLLLVLILKLKSNIYSTTRTFSFLPFNVQATTTKPTNCSFSFELMIRYLKAVADLREGPVGPGPPSPVSYTHLPSPRDA